MTSATHARGTRLVLTVLALALSSDVAAIAQPVAPAAAALTPATLALMRTLLGYERTSDAADAAATSRWLAASLERYQRLTGR